LIAAPGQRAAVGFRHLLGNSEPEADTFGLAGNERLE
jgi:hypothetical protein